MTGRARVNRRAKLVAALARAVAIFITTVAVAWAFGLTTGQVLAVGVTLSTLTANWGPRVD